MKTMRELQHEVIRDRINQFKGNRTETARSLKISVRTLRDMIKEMPMELRSTIVDYDYSVKMFQRIIDEHKNEIWKAVQLLKALSFGDHWCDLKDRKHSTLCANITRFVRRNGT